MSNLFNEMAAAGVLDAITSLMNMIARVVNIVRSMPEPVKQAVAIFIKLQIWFAVIISTLTVLIGLTIAYILYVWGMAQMLRWGLMAVVHFSRSLMTMGGWLLTAAFRMHYWALSARAGTIATTRFAFVNTVLNGVLRVLSGTMLLASRVLAFLGGTMTFTGYATMWTARAGLLLTKVYEGSCGFWAGIISFLKVQLVWMFRNTAALWRFVAARFAANSAMGRGLAIMGAIIARNAMTAASYAALALASVFTTLGMHGIAGAFIAMNVAGGPVLWIIGAIVIAVALLAVGIYLLIRHFSTVVGWIKSAIQWVAGLSRWFWLLLGPIGMVIIALLYLNDLWNKIRGKKPDTGEDSKTGKQDTKPGSGDGGEDAGVSARGVPETGGKEEGRRGDERDRVRGGHRGSVHAGHVGYGRHVGARAHEWGMAGSGRPGGMDERGFRTGDHGLGGPGGPGGHGYGGVGGAGGVGGVGEPGIGGVGGPGGIGGDGSARLPDGDRAMAYGKAPEMNLPVARTSTNNVTTTNTYSFNMTFNVPEGSDANQIAQIVQTKVEEALDTQFREAQTNIAGAIT